MEAVITIDGKDNKIPPKSQIDIFITNKLEAAADEKEGIMLNIIQERSISKEKLYKAGFDILVLIYNIRDCHISLWVSDTKESYFEVSKMKELPFHEKKPL